MINFRSINDLDMLIRSKLSMIPSVDCIVGIPRSGMLPATLIALYLGKPLIQIEEIEHRIIVQYSTRFPLTTKAQHILVVDDSCSSGAAMTKAKSYLEQFANKLTFTYCAVYATQYAINKGVLDFYFERLEHVRLFEWNILDHNILQRSCVDLDGVLCVDPTPEENDDGKKYLKFLSDAKPKFIPHYTIKQIVTCRLEKYRSPTIQWLNAHNVKCESLQMMNVNTIAERHAIGHANYKANIYQHSNAELFIESDNKQAEQIHAITGKPVYSVNANKFYGG